MTLTYQVLGSPLYDNALFVKLDSGQAITRLQFDCGETVLYPLGLTEVQAIDHLFFSHLHMDHVGGFDSFVRANFNRITQPTVIWGPPETATILHGRLRGYMWNLIQDDQGTWLVHDVFPDRIQTTRFELSERFALAHHEGAQSRTGNLILDAETFTVEALAMDHQTPSLAYIVREKVKQNIDPNRLRELGLAPGPWLKQLKEPAPGQTTVKVNGQDRSLEELRALLLVANTGDSIAYLTDFRLNEEATARLEGPLRGCATMVCESQYQLADAELAETNYHMTSTAAARLALRAGVGELVLFHLSGRYLPEQWPKFLEEAQAVFPRTRFPEGWIRGGMPQPR